MEAKGPDGFLYRIYPYLQQYQGDLQEFATIALTRGHKGRQPCPKCHISASHATAEDLAKHHDSAPRQHVTLRNALRANVSQDFYKSRGMWGQRNAFFKATDNIYKALAVDPLHQFDLGIIDYVVGGIELLIQRTQGRQANNCLKELYARTSVAMPPYHALVSRSSSLLAVDPAKKKSLKAYEWKALSHILVPAYHNLVPAYPIVQEIVRHMCDFSLWSRVSTPTDATIATADNALSLFLQSWQKLQSTLVQLSAQSKQPKRNVGDGNELNTEGDEDKGDDVYKKESDKSDDDNQVDLAQGNDEIKWTGEKERMEKKKKKRMGYEPPRLLKLHLLTHWSEMTRQLGPVDRQGSQRGEKEHSTTTKPSARHSNFDRATVGLQSANWIALLDAIQDALETVYWLEPGAFFFFQDCA